MCFVIDGGNLHYALCVHRVDTRCTAHKNHGLVRTLDLVQVMVRYFFSTTGVKETKHESLFFFTEQNMTFLNKVSVNTAANIVTKN